jgi:hypothetical protein
MGIYRETVGDCGDVEVDVAVAGLAVLGGAVGGRF